MIDTINVPVIRGRVDTISGVIYSNVFEGRHYRPLKMNLLLPSGKDKRPAVLYFPGGGFLSADNNSFLQMRMALAEAGFVVASVEYRVIPERFPALLEDAKSAVRFLRSKAEEFRIDSERIGVFGNSAGGYLAMMMGCTNSTHIYDKGDCLEHSSCISSVVSLYGISNLLTIGGGEFEEIHCSPASNESVLLNGTAYISNPGGSIKDDPEKAMAASPAGNVSGSMPPFMLMHGTADKLVSPSQSEEFYRLLTGAGNMAELVMVEGASHGDIYWFQKPVVDRVVDWFRKTLG